MEKITVIKRNSLGQAVWRYAARVLERGSSHIVLEAHFDRPDTDLDGLVLATGDRFLETFYADRWYNIFRIYDGMGERLKGWYCNIGRPAEISDGTVAYDDLAIDLIVFPDGRQVVLDLEEFEALDLPLPERQEALAALETLQASFQSKTRSDP